MSKKSGKNENQIDLNESNVNKQLEKSTNQTNTSHYITQFFLFLSAILIGLLIQNYFILPNQYSYSKAIIKDEVDPAYQVQKEPLQIRDGSEMNAIYKEMSEKLRKEILEEILKEKEIKKIKDENSKESDQEKITSEKNVGHTNNDAKNVVIIDDKKMDDKNSEIKFTGQQPIVIDPQSIHSKKEAEKEKMKREKQAIREKEKRNSKANQDIQIKEERKTQENNNNVPNEVKNFKSIKISKMKPKKMWIPIPNSNGGHRRCPAIEVKSGKNHGSSVNVWLYEEFLSVDEAKSLIEAHESHLSELSKQKPIICYDSIKTLRKQLIKLDRLEISELVSPLDFTQETMCLNQTFSRQLEKWGLKWSYNTAFYPGESRFSKIFGKLIEDATMLNETHGGKFQITSYPKDVGFDSHTSCIIDSNEERDKYATFMVFLNELGADGGGEALFPEMGIDVKPRTGRALTWNNMNYDTGKCEPASALQSAHVKHEVKKKYVITRHYYYKNFYSLGKRIADSTLPERPNNTPKVACSSLDNSCHMYDEWNPDHLLSYRRNQNKLY